MKLRCGALRVDGFRFWGYRSLANGSKREIWVSPETFEKNKAIGKKHNKLKAERLKTDDDFRAASVKAVREWHHEDYRRRMFYAAKQCHKNNGTPFDLTSYKDIPYTETCPIFGWKLVIGGGQRSPSMDKIDPAKGYTIGNIIVVSQLANQIKSNATPSQIAQVAKFYEKLSKRK